MTIPTNKILPDLTGLMRFIIVDIFGDSMYALDAVDCFGLAGALGADFRIDRLGNAQWLALAGHIGTISLTIFFIVFLVISVLRDEHVGKRFLLFLKISVSALMVNKAVVDIIGKTLPNKLLENILGLGFILIFAAIFYAALYGLVIGLTKIVVGLIWKIIDDGFIPYKNRYYNALNGKNQLIKEYNELVEENRGLINDYNELVHKYNDLVDKYESLGADGGTLRKLMDEIERIKNENRILKDKLSYGAGSSASSDSYDSTVPSELRDAFTKLFRFYKSDAERKHVYRRLGRVFHPDGSPSKVDAEIMQILNTTYADVSRK